MTAGSWRRTQPRARVAQLEPRRRPTNAPAALSLLRRRRWLFLNRVRLAGFPAGPQALVNPKVVALQTQSKPFNTAKHHGKRIAAGYKPIGSIVAAYA
jgi:hypothetical protein